MADKKQYLYNQEGKIVGELGTDFPDVKNFETYVNQETAILDAKILELENKFNNTLPIGTILINEVASNFNPGIGTWELIGQLQNGQTIVGGSNTNGYILNHSHKMNSHAHKWNEGMRGDGFDHTDQQEAVTGWYTWDVFGIKITQTQNQDEMHITGDSINASTHAYTERSISGTNYTTAPTYVNTSNNMSNGGDYNKPYGLGLGTKYVWKRIG